MQQLRTLEIDVNNNLAFAYNKLHEPTKAMKFANDVAKSHKIFFMLILLSFS